MRIGIDCRMLGSGYGLGRYVGQLVESLQNIDQNNQYVLFLTNDNFDQVKDTNNIKKVRADIPWYSFAEQMQFKKIIKKENVDVMHFPHWNVPLLYHDPFIVTIHDLTMFHFPRPEATTRSKVVFWFKDKIHRIVIRHAIKKAQHVIAASQFTRQDIVDTFRVSPQNISVIYQAPFRLSGDIESREHILETYNITKPYTLYVGAAYPHKNLDRLIESWNLFCDEFGDEYQLVLVGKKNYFYQRLLSSKNYELARNIIYTDFVPDRELVALYKHASLYIFPSLYEGFGLPPLEAIQYGVPVVSSDASCLPEILGDAALYFDPKNIEQISQVMHNGLTNDDIRMSLLQNGRARIADFSQEKSAREIQTLYMKYA